MSAPYTCLLGHHVTVGSLGVALPSGERFCLICLAAAHKAASDEIVGRLVMTMLDVAPMPSRLEVERSAQPEDSPINAWLCNGSTRCTELVDTEGGYCLRCERDMQEAFDEMRSGA